MRSPALAQAGWRLAHMPQSSDRLTL